MPSSGLYSVWCFAFLQDFTVMQIQHWFLSHAGYPNMGDELDIWLKPEYAYVTFLIFEKA
jgi:hypothetical protein